MAELSIPGVTIGHDTDAAGETGCTVIELPEGTTASYEVRGGAPAERELWPLEPDKSVTQVDAVLLTGGSVFGLAAADGVVRHLAAQGRGVGTPAGPVPIVPTLGLFDLGSGSPTAHPDAAAGSRAAAAASTTFETGRVGAGTGAHAGQWRGPEGRRGGGLGHAARSLGDLIVEAVVAVNAFGDITDGTDDGLDAVTALRQAFDFAPERTHTTIGCVVTNARLDKVGCRVLAQGAHDGLARALTPPHTRFDGDAFVACATGQVEVHVDVVRMLAVAAVAAAIRSAAH